MLRSPHKSPTEAPASRFLRRRPEERRRRRYLWIGAGLLGAYLAYSFLLSDTGLFRVAALRRENAALVEKRQHLTERVEDLERRRKEQAKDPLVEERVARERFHLVKEGEIVYRYDASPADSLP